MKPLRASSPRSTARGAKRIGTALSRARVRFSGREYRASLRREMIAAYGSKCECPYCNETIPEFLTLEHKRKDGAEHRLRVGRNAQAQLLDLRRQGWPTEDFGLLCFNCNIGAGKSQCPHFAYATQILGDVAMASVQRGLADAAAGRFIDRGTFSG